MILARCNTGVRQWKQKVEINGGTYTIRCREVTIEVYKIRKNKKGVEANSVCCTHLYNTSRDHSILLHSVVLHLQKSI